jgi:hypothetical protein
MTVSRIRRFELHLRREIARERAEAILDESPPPLRAKADWIRRTFEDDWRRSVVSRYQVAVALREIYDDVTENQGSVYGARAVEAIQQAFGGDDGVIYQALHVADAFTPEQSAWVRPFPGQSAACFIRGRPACPPDSSNLRPM